MIAIIIFSLQAVVGFAEERGEKINLNSANVEILDEQLKFVGEKLAMRIVEYREANGGFKNIEELTNVKGVGRKVIDSNRDNIELK